MASHQTGLLLSIGILMLGFTHRSSSNEIHFPDGLHPFIYFSTKDITEMRIKAYTTHEKIAKRIREAANTMLSAPGRYLPPTDYEIFASKWNEVYGNNLCAISLYPVIYPGASKLLDFIEIYMDRMESYPDWYVADSHGRDQVPIGHSLTGFAVAYDFLHHHFDQERRKRYYDVIKKTTSYMYQVSLKGGFGWTREYIHNHAPSNYVGILLGALIVSAHEPQAAKPWIEDVKLHLNFSLELFSYVSDGSIDEGVSYGTYTTRGLTQYVYLALKHLATDHTANPWLKEYFWSLYKTILPGFQRAIGVGDANHNWMYGPESQLVFLDTYVLRNGYGNWLADRIREARPREVPLAPSSSQAWSTLHTEFLFYNASLAPVKPIERSKDDLWVFADWGVVTYGGGQKMKPGNTFLSFKSGILNGEAVDEIWNTGKYPKRVTTRWRNFNPGHEHPDQNSFVFVPNGRYFLSESFYAYKFTWLDNVVVFSPSETSNCFQPWEGQIGECGKWLDFKKYTNGERGEIVTATYSDGMVFAAGEAVGVYSKSLQLASVFRGVLLLNSEVLIIVDAIRLRPGSKTKRASAFFHNGWTKFEKYNHMNFPGGKVIYPEGEYTMFSMTPQGEKVNVSLHNDVRIDKLKQPTNYVNATFSLHQEVTHLVHVFSGPNYIIKSALLKIDSKSSGVSLALDINGKEYRANVATLIKSTSRLLDPTKERMKITGFGGFASVRVGSVSHFFGLDKGVLAGESWLSGKRSELSRVLDKERERSASFSANLNGGLFPNKLINWNSYVQRGSGDGFPTTGWSRVQNESRNHLYRVNNLLSLVTIGSMVIYILGYSRKRQSWSKFFRNRATCMAAILLLCIAALNVACIGTGGKNICFANRKNSRGMISASGIPKILSSPEPPDTKVSIPTCPFVFSTFLPGSGGELIEKVFEDSNMTLYLSSSETKIPLDGSGLNWHDFCMWPTETSETHLHTMGWFNSLKTRPVLHFNQATRNEEAVDRIIRRLRENYNIPIVFHDKAGFWMTKLPWLRNVIGKENFQPMVIIRDPRSWIHALISNSTEMRNKKTLQNLMTAFSSIEKSCSKYGSDFPFFRYLILQRKSDEQPYTLIERLAILWTISIGSVLANEANEYGQWPLQVVKFEDILKEHKSAIADVFLKLGLPLGLPQQAKIERIVRTGHYSIPFDGLVSSQILDRWRTGLSKSDIAKIETICCELMEIVGYKCG